MNNKLSRLEEVKRRAVARTERRIQMNVEKMAEDNPTVREDFDELQEARQAKDTRREEARKQPEAEATETTKAPQKSKKVEETK